MINVYFMYGRIWEQFLDRGYTNDLFFRAICDIKSSIISLIKLNLKISMALDGMFDNSVLSNINY